MRPAMSGPAQAPLNPGRYTSAVPAISAVLIAQDEEHNLPDALRSVAFCDEVVVVDAGSTDHTREVAEAAGARVILNRPWPGFVEQRNVAVDAAPNDWVLAVDADERVTPALREEICALRAAGFDHAGYRMSRVAFYLGRWIRGTDWYPDPQLRLFDRRHGRWQGALVHESVVVAGSVGRLRCELEHRPYHDIADHMRSIDLYTTLWARQAFEAGRRAGAPETVAGALWAFLRNYLLKGGVLEGQAGLAVSVLNSYYTYAKLAKLHELALGDGAGR
jgi:glycosyltransferase involved in cell wall biosynthesis